MEKRGRIRGVPALRCLPLLRTGGGSRFGQFFLAPLALRLPSPIATVIGGIESRALEDDRRLGQTPADPHVPVGARDRLGITDPLHLLKVRSAFGAFVLVDGHGTHAVFRAAGPRPRWGVALTRSSV